MLGTLDNVRNTVQCEGPGEVEGEGLTGGLDWVGEEGRWLAGRILRQWEARVLGWPGDTRRGRAGARPGGPGG